MGTLGNKFKVLSSVMLYSYKSVRNLLICSAPYEQLSLLLSHRNYVNTCIQSGRLSDIWMESKKSWGERQK